MSIYSALRPVQQQPAPSQQGQFSQTNPFAQGLSGLQALQGLGQLWRENLTDSGRVASPQEKESTVASQRARAEMMINLAAAATGATAAAGDPYASPTMKPSVASGENLGVPTSLLGWADLAAEAALLPKPGLHGGLGGRDIEPQRAQNFLKNAFNNPNADAMKSSFLRTLQNEPARKWLEIPWIYSAKDAVALARSSKKPLFIELIVGRLADATSDVC